MNSKGMKALLRLIRIPNLVIIVVTLCLLYARVEGQDLKWFSFFILCLGTVFIAAAGNIINDIFDVEIDKINKKDRVIIGRLISAQAAWNSYFFLNGLALGLSIWARMPDLFVFFLGAVLLLYFYSALWKRQALIGNLVVAFLCAWVVVQFWWFSRASLTIYWQVILAGYTLFAFLSTLVRELVKDLEDLEGDQAQGCKTIAIQKGTIYTKKIILGCFCALLIVLSIEAFFFYDNSVYLAFIYLFLVLIMPVFYLIKRLWKAEESSDFGQLSRLIKVYMLLGLLLLLLV